MQSTATKQSDWYVEVEGIPGTWATASAPTKQAQSTKVRDGGADEETLPGDPTYNDVDLTRPWRRGREGQTLVLIDRSYGQQRRATWYNKSPDGVIAERLTYLVTIGGYTGPSADSMSSQPSTIGLTVGVDRFVGVG